MRKTHIIFWFFISLVPVSCSMQQERKDERIVDDKPLVFKDPFHRLCQYWEVTDAENPTFRDLYDDKEEDVINYPGIIFMTDSTFLENPKAAMRYGKFIFKGKEIDAQFDDGKKAVYTIQRVQGDTMQVRRVEKDHTTILFVEGNRVFWPDASLNPFNKINSLWRIKPSKSESEQELKERLKGCVQFYEYLFLGNAESDNKEIDFVGLPTCFKWYQGGIFVLSEKNLDKKWINCFYSKEQALQARQMMEDAVTTKKYDWDTTQTNWLKQTANVLKQIHDKM
ncbi:hypothetical protein FW778_16385 [Ginsengibacter hankyongi]|uniref:Uncharacterized protein n=1 Tax=Ginsengibacter hankyongi TaxID=2607284 RepID=A0A5J5IDS7_9BACT|nr:hypothetical protein [Ginsengibacter hankyongi]KAA9037671.1 hypothetical protein FW778_16385 [Ginsengibacter hankyongi]